MAKAKKPKSGIRVGKLKAIADTTAKVLLEERKPEDASKTAMTESDQKRGLIVPDQNLPNNLFVLPIPGPVVFPALLAPLMISIPNYIATVEEVLNRNRYLGLVLHREPDFSEENVTFKNIHSFGVVVKVLKRLKMPDGSVSVLVHSLKRFQIKKGLSEHPHLVAEVEYLEDIVEESLDKQKPTELDALVRTTLAHVKKLSESNPFFTDELRMAMMNAPGPGTVADLVAFALNLGRSDSQELLETLSVKGRFEKILIHLRREQDLSDLQKKIVDDVNTKVNTLQRDFFLKEQLKVIKKELGVEEEGREKNLRSFRERIDAANMPEEVKKIALDELNKFETMSEQSPEYNVIRNYLELFVTLPWSIETPEADLKLTEAEAILNEDHWGLEKVKERILEFLAVRSLKSSCESAATSKTGSILCLVGPPGVGKTSIGKSIAKTLGRKFYRFSVGGLRDEAEIKGHRRTYIGAMPGKVLQGIKRAGSKNCVLLLDEIDKLANHYHGDPASALLEVLDPEQNVAFLDHYLDVPFDLSNVLFIATANTTANIPGPLLDRMEVIELPGYTLEEKEEIASRHVIPKEIENHGLKRDQVVFEKDALRRLMADYAREPGLRILSQQIQKILRKVAAKKIRSDQELKNKVDVVFDSKKSRQRIKNAASRAASDALQDSLKGTAKAGSAVQTIRSDDLESYLGPKRFYNEVAERITGPGIVVGLAWTAMGGDILFVEAVSIPGTGQLRLTGQMGDVMSESASIALSYVKNHLQNDVRFNQEFFKNRDIHLHLPAGAIPKDGPSAGITMATAFYSMLTGKVIRPFVAMTGELSLTGKVLPVGGIKEKLLAARRSGITEVIIPKLNEKDLKEIPDYALKDLKVQTVSQIDDVFSLVFSETARISPKKAAAQTVNRRVVLSKKTDVSKVIVSKNERSTKKMDQSAKKLRARTN